MTNKSPKNEQTALLQIIANLQDYDDEDKIRLLRTITTYFNLNTPIVQQHQPRPPEQQTTSGLSATRQPSFSDHEDLSPKEFMQQKAPTTDMDRVACLAYYLNHFRDTIHFKTLDISRLNTEAAQAKFSNAANSVNNATKRGLLAPAGKGMKQLSADGEQFVDALPDRDAAKVALQKLSKRRSRGRSKAKK